MNINTTPLLKSIALASTLVLLNACIIQNDDDVTESDHYAVITANKYGAIGSDGSSDISIISLEDFSIDNTNFGAGSDVTVSTNKDHFYHLDRKKGNVSKFHINNPETILSQHATQDTNVSTSNPHKLIIKDDNTGYVIRYNSSEIWIVNPSANNSETYQTGSVDLNDYTSDDGNAEATDAMLIDNKLYVLIQNLESYAPQTAYIAIFDTDNMNVEIETNTDVNTPKGIALIGTNPSKFVYLSSNKMIYVSNIGSYAPDYNGGIESVNINNYSTDLIVDDGTTGETSDHPYGQTISLAILNSTRGYFVGSASYQKTNVYSFNPTSGEIDATPLFTTEKDISDIEIGPLGDLWVSNRTDVGITIFSTVDHSISQALISTDPLFPDNIEFVSIQKQN